MPQRPTERSPDGRYVIVDGRRWRSTDPMLPEARREQLVSELMSARRAVGAATRAGDEKAERLARERVHSAKVELGERGPPWWERIEEAIRRAVADRGPGKTVCPSEVAQSLADGVPAQSLMPHVREAAAALAERGEIAVTQGGRSVDARTARGPIRLGSARESDS